MFAMIKDSFGLWRIIHLQGISTLRARYARSKFGQLWISLTTAATMLMIGVVWSQIWGLPISDFLTYLSIGQIIYVFFVGVHNDACSALVSDFRLYSNEPKPYFVSSLVSLYRNFLILLHSIPTLILIDLIWGKFNFSNIITISYLLSLLLVILFIVTTSYCLSLVSARFRDFGAFMSIMLNISYMLVPVLWKIEDMNKSFVENYLLVTPYAQILVLLRDPIMGSFKYYEMAFYGLLCWSILFLGLSVVLHKILSKRLIFWLS